MKFNQADLTMHHAINNLSDRFAFILCKCLRWLADLFFQKRYGHRAVILETVAAVPGMGCWNVNTPKMLTKTMY